jgi:hypothetical protein
VLAVFDDLDRFRVRGTDTELSWVISSQRVMHPLQAIRQWQAGG